MSHLHLPHSNFNRILQCEEDGSTIKRLYVVQIDGSNHEYVSAYDKVVIKNENHAYVMSQEVSVGANGPGGEVIGMKKIIYAGMELEFDDIYYEMDVSGIRHHEFVDRIIDGEEKFERITLTRISPIEWRLEDPRFVNKLEPRVEGGLRLTNDPDQQQTVMPESHAGDHIDYRGISVQGPFIGVVKTK